MAEGLVAENLVWAPGGNRVLGPLNLSLPDSGLVAVVGPNGGGKTSFLRCLAGLEPAVGVLTWRGLVLPQTVRERAQVFSMLTTDEASQLPWTLGETIAMAEGSDPSWRAELVDILGLRGLLEEPFVRLSKGYQTLGHLARILWRDTPIVLLDEPIAHLDWNHRTRLTSLLARLLEKGRLVLVSLHDHFSRLAAARVLGFREGRCVFNGPAGEVDENVVRTVWLPEDELTLAALMDEWRGQAHAN